MAEPLPDILDVTQRHAEWAKMFEGGTTNFAVRKRHQQDIKAHEQNLRAGREAAVQERILSDREFQNAHFRERKMATDEKLADQTLQFRAELYPATLRLKEAQTKAAFALDRSRVLAAETKEELTQKMADDTALFSERAKEAAKVHKLGTPEYARAIAQARIEAPGADKAFFDDIWKTTSSELPPEQVLENFKKVQSLAPAATVTATASGGTTISQKPGAETAPLERERAIYLGLREKAKARLAKESDPAKQALHKADLDEYETALNAATQKLESARTPAAPAVAVSGGAGNGAMPSVTRPIFKDKAGNRAYKNPDGTFEAIP